MWKVDKFGCYCWIVFFEGVLYLQSAPMFGNGHIDPDERCDVSKDAFTNDELNDFVHEVARIAEEPRVVVRGWIRG